MRILLLGDYSNVHATLAKGFRALGHECVVASDGDKWKDYDRDVDLGRAFGLRGNADFAVRLLRALPKFRGFDVVQLVNPVFLELKAERIAPFYRYLRRHNGKVVLGAFGMDYYWAWVNTHTRPLRYSDFNFGDTIRDDVEARRYRDEWVGTPKETLCRMVAEDCDGIVAGLYEYWATYKAYRPKGCETDVVGPFDGKMTFIPFPVEVPEEKPRPPHDTLRIFCGVSRNRDVYKGTDVMRRAAQTVRQAHPGRVELQEVTGVPYAQYQRMMEDSDAILDQLYSYTPAMNSLLAMSKGIINIGGGEPENYDILGERELRPIINVQPTYESCYEEIERLALHPERVPLLQRQSVEYVRRHHDYVKVARRYLDFYETLRV